MSIVTHNELDLAIKRVLSTLRQVSEQAHGTSLRSSARGALIQTHLQTTFAVQFMDPTSSALYELILSHALKAEQVGPGGFDVFIQTFLDGVKQSPAVSEKSVLEGIRGSGCRLPSWHDLRTALLTLIDDRQMELVMDAFELSGFGGRILVEKSTSDQASLELIRGYSFPVKPAFPVSATLLTPRVACIDGFVESVAELHLVLETTHSAKVPLLLFLRGMADEVGSTLRVNYERGSLRVIPIVVPFDLEGVNVLADIAVASSGDVVSSTKGQLISSLTVLDFSTIPKATVYPEKVVLVNPTSGPRVSSHVKMLRDKRPDQPDLGRLIDLRIKSLSPNVVVVRLPDDDRFVIDSQAIDYSMRTIRALLNHGVLQDGSFAAPRLGGLYYAMKCREMLNALGGVITP